jgi:hypothetical protein
MTRARNGSSITSIFFAPLCVRGIVDNNDFVFGNAPILRCLIVQIRKYRNTESLSMAAVCTTLLGVPAQELETFVRWHLHVGFDLVFLFFDCAADCAEEQPAIHAAQRVDWASRVIVTFSDAALREQQRRFNGRWRTLEPFLHQVPARQEINAETALGLAGARGMRWLLHLDADELFLPMRRTGGCPRDFRVEDAARMHFQALDDAGVGLVTYKNLEGVAEHAAPRMHSNASQAAAQQEDDGVQSGGGEEKGSGGSSGGGATASGNPLHSAGNVFERVCCFREHFSDIPLTPDAMACMREWSERSPVCAREGTCVRERCCCYNALLSLLSAFRSFLLCLSPSLAGNQQQEIISIYISYAISICISIYLHFHIVSSSSYLHVSSSSYLHI